MEKGGEVGDLAMTVTPGRGFLSSITLYKVRSFYLYSTVMFGISFEGEVNMSHCFSWLPFDWLSMLHALKCQQLIALFV